MVIVDSTGDSGEVTLVGHSAGEIPFVLISQSALPVQQSDSNQSVVDQERLNQAIAAPGVVPDELLDSYTTDGPVTFSTGYFDENLVFDKSQLQPTFAFAVTPSTTSFAWASNPDVAIYSVLRDGAVVGTVTGNSFSESGLLEKQAYLYTITGVGGDGASVTSRSIPIETLGSTSALGSRNEGLIVPMTYQPNTTAFTYETFITDAQVTLGFYATMGCGQGGHENRTFGGDNRSWVSPNYMTPNDQPNYRTMLFVSVNWDSPSPYDMVITGGIGATHLYDNGTLIDTRTATFENTQIVNTYKSGAYAQTQWQHSVGNPFCAAGAITYDNTMRFYRSGTIEISGWRYAAPNHEAYGRWDNGSGEFWDAMYLDTNESFDCLGGSQFCSTDPISVSKTH